MKNPNTQPDSPFLYPVVARPLGALVAAPIVKLAAEMQHQSFDLYGRDIQQPTPEEVKGYSQDPLGTVFN